jgi:hypothetical protein
MMKSSQVEVTGNLSVMKKIGIFGFLFFLVKGMLWIIVPMVIAYLKIN